MSLERRKFPDLRIFLSVLVVAFAAVDTKAELISPMKAEATDMASVEFRGYVVMGEKEEYVSLSTPGSKARWLPIGGRFGNMTITRYDRSKQFLVMTDGQGVERQLPIMIASIESDTSVAKVINTTAGPRVKLPQIVAGSKQPSVLPKHLEIVEEFPPKDEPRSVEGLDWDWINSDDNPMRKAPSLPSMVESRRIATMSTQERDNLVEVYRQCGWDVSVFVQANGRAGAQFKKISKPK